MKYTIVIEETVVSEFEIVAKNETEALEIARKNYRNNEFVLEPGEMQNAKIAIVNVCSDELDWIEV